MRISKGQPQFGSRETFSMDSTLAPIIAAGLIKFKEVSEKSGFGGFPVSMYTELGYDINGNHGEEVEEQASQLWKEKLNKMIFAFQNYDDEPVYHGAWNYAQERHNEDGTVSLIGFGPADREDMDRWEREVRDPWQDRIKEGIDLFAKHYASLWW